MKKLHALTALLLSAALAACGGNSAETAAAPASGAGAQTNAAAGSVCEQYEKAFADSIQNVDAATKEMMQKSFEQGKEAMDKLPEDQRDAVCQESLKALTEGASATAGEDDKAEAASDAAEEAKEASEEAKEEKEEAK